MLVTIFLLSFSGRFLLKSDARTSQELPSNKIEKLVKSLTADCVSSLRSVKINNVSPTTYCKCVSEEITKTKIMSTYIKNKDFSMLSQSKASEKIKHYFKNRTGKIKLNECVKVAQI